MSCPSLAIDPFAEHFLDDPYAHHDALRDPRHWPDPDAFDITRNASGHVGFGFGIHQCLGQMVARMEMEAVLGALIAQVTEIRPTGAPRVRLNNTLHALESVPVALIPARA